MSSGDASGNGTERTRSLNLVRRKYVVSRLGRVALSRNWTLGTREGGLLRLVSQARVNPHSPLLSQSRRRSTNPLLGILSAYLDVPELPYLARKEE